MNLQGWGMGQRAREDPVAAAASPPAEADEGSLRALVAGRYRYARDAKLEMLETWATALAFFSGEQWRQWEEQSRRLVKQTRIPSWRVLPVYNQLPGIVDVAAAKLARSRQLPRARADEFADEDRARASKGTQALQGWWHAEDLELLEHEANVGRIILGCSFFHLYWDPHQMVKLPAQDPLTGRMRAEYAPAGQVCVEVLTPFDVFPEPVEHWREASWVIVARRRPLHWFQDTFGAAGAKVTADQGDVDSVFAGLIPGLDQTTRAGAPHGDGMATLQVYYEKPSRRYPRGRTAMVAGEVELFARDTLPLPFLGLKNPLPLKLFGFRHVTKRLWPKGLIEECISPQRELNRARGNISEWLRLHRGPKWFIDRAWKVKPKSITSAPDEVVEGDFKGQKPTAVHPPEMPGWLANLPLSEREEMRHLAGQHEVSEGGVPRGVEAASAIQLLQQAENTRISSPALLGKVGLEETAAHALTVMAERYREPRLLRVPNRRLGEQSVTVTGEELGPLEVVVELADGATDNDAVRQQQLSEWLGAGLLEILASPMAPAVLRLLQDVGLGWMVDSLNEELPAVHEAQAEETADEREHAMVFERERVAGDLLKRMATGTTATGGEAR